MSGEMKERLLASSVCLVSSVAINVAGWWWIAAFMKMEEMRIPYVLLISMLLSLVFYMFASVRRSGHLIGALAMGMLAGVLCGTVALTLSNLAISDGIDRLVRSFQREGLGASISDVPVSLLLGSWIVGAVSFVASWKYLMWTTRRKNRESQLPGL